MNQASNEQHHVYVIMGVSGSGKSVVAKAVSEQLNAAFLDGDFLHPRANIMKMASGHPLNDDDRMPWLALIADAAFAMQRTNQISIIVCSSLKKIYRDRLRQGNDNLSFIYLKGDFDLIQSRLQARKGHFFKPEMLLSQFETLEEPQPNEQDVVAIDINQPLNKVVDDVVHYIKR